MRTKTKLILSAILIPIVLVVVCYTILVVRERIHFVECSIDSHFVEQLRAASATNAVWPTDPKQVATRLVISDLFPRGRPLPEMDLGATIGSKSNDRCEAVIVDGLWETNTMLLATVDKITLQREGMIWVPIHRKVSWQTKKRPGWVNDPF